MSTATQAQAYVPHKPMLLVVALCRVLSRVSFRLSLIFMDLDCGVKGQFLMHRKQNAFLLFHNIGLVFDIQLSRLQQT